MRLVKSHLFHVNLAGDLFCQLRVWVSAATTTAALVAAHVPTPFFTVLHWTGFFCRPWHAVSLPAMNWTQPNAKTRSTPVVWAFSGCKCKTQHVEP